MTALNCAVLCSPFQSRFVSRDPVTLALMVRLSPAYCTSLAFSCGLVSCSSMLPPSLQLVLDPDGLSQSTLLPPAVIVPLGSAAVTPPTGLLHGGLLGNYSWTLVAGDTFGQLVTTTTALPQLVVPGFAESTANQLGGGRYGGNYVVTRPGRYTLPVTLDNSTVANAPFQLVYLAPTPCLSPQNTTIDSFMASPPLPVCSEYNSNGCCDANLVATLNAHWAYLAATFGAFPPSECTRQLEILACGMACSPRNLAFVNNTGGDCGNFTGNGTFSGNGTNTTCFSSVSICTTFCDDIWNACMSVVPAGSSSSVAVLYNGNRQAFCAAQFPPFYLGAPIAPTFNSTVDTPCFFGLLREPACANTSYVTDRKPLVAGEASFFTIVAQDCFGNPRISGGDTFVVTAPPGVLIGAIVDRGDGTYTVPITAFRACLDACVVVGVSLGGEQVQNAPFGLNVVPNCPYGPSTLYTPVNPNSELPFRFDFTAYDQWLNLAYTASESVFSATLSDAVSGATGIPLRVVSLGCNGTFAALVQDDAGALNASSCLRFCLDTTCPATGVTTNVFCAPLCNQTSFIFFSDTGTRIDMRFIENITTLPPAFYGEFDCCLLVRNCELLGQGAYCVVRNQTAVQIFLPYNATVCSSVTANCPPPLSNLYLDCTLLNITGGACSVPVVTQILSPNPFPVVRLAAPDFVVRCAGLTVDGAATTNAGGRPAAWRWQLIGPFAAGDNHVAINTFLATISSNPLVLDQVTAVALLVENTTYRLQASVTNHLEQTGTAVVVIRMLPDSSREPVLFISPSSPVAAAVMQPLGYHAFLQGTGCVAASVTREIVDPVAWVMPLSPPQPLYQFLANRTVNQNSLELPPSTLPLLSSPSSFQVWALSSSPVSAVRTVTPRPRAPFVYVSMGSPRLFVLGDANLILNVSEMFEWNQPGNASLSVSWSCVSDTGGPCFNALQSTLYMPPLPAIGIPPYILGLGIYTFRATVSSSLGGGPTVVPIVILTNGTAPDVAVDNYNANVRGGTAPTESVALLATVARDIRFGVMDTVWTVESRNAAPPRTLPGLPEGAVFVPGSTGSDAMYSARVSARDSDGEGYAVHSWTANDHPNGGTCAIDRLDSGTLFRLRCSNWEDRDSDPLSYVVNVAVPGFQAPLPLSYGRWFAPFFFLELLPSQLPYQVQVIVADQTDHGRTTYASLPAVSVPGTFPTCPETAAMALATATLAQQNGLDSSRLAQRVVSVCSLLRSAAPCDPAARSSALSTVLAVLRCIIRSEPSRDRSALAANAVTYCLDGPAPGSLTASQFDQAMELLSRLANTTDTSYQQEGTRVQPVAQAIVSALNAVLLARAPVFDSVAPSEPASASVRQLLQRLAQSLAADLRPGESGPSCRASRLAVSAGWWLPVPSAVYGYPSVASLTPAASFLDSVAQQVRSFVHPRLGSANLLPTWAVAANFSLFPQPQLVLPTSWQLSFGFRASGSASLVFAAARQPAVCAAMSPSSFVWDTSVCGTPSQLNATHLSCQCLSDGRFLAALPLNVLPDGSSISPLLPGPGGSVLAVPLVPTLPAGLAIAALLVLALAALAAVLALRGATAAAGRRQLWVSPNVAPADIVPADNRVRVPLVPAAPLAAAGPLSSVAAQDRPALSRVRVIAASAPAAAAVGENIWVSDDEDEERNDEHELLRSQDVAPSVDGDDFYDPRNEAW